MAVKSFYSGKRKVNGQDQDTLYYFDRPQGAIREITDPTAFKDLDFSKLSSLGDLNFQENSLAGGTALSSKTFFENLERRGLSGTEGFPGLQGKSFSEIEAALSSPEYLKQFNILWLPAFGFSNSAIALSLPAPTI